MMPDTKAHTVYGTIIHGFDFQKKHKIRFDAGSNGSFKTKLDGQMTRVDGSILTERDLPSIPIADNGYVFKHWDPNPIGIKVTRDLTFTAKYEKVFVSDTDVEKPTVEKISIRFEPGEHGTITGNTQIFINKGGLIDGKVATKEEIVEISKLPGREGLLSMLLSCFQAPMRNFAYAVSQVANAKPASEAAK